MARIALTIFLALHSCFQTTAGGQSDTGATRITLGFRAADSSFAAARAEYERIWAADGQRMVAALEAAAGLRFIYPLYADTLIVVTVREAVSQSGFRDRAGITMRASYSADTKRATLMHELGHRLMAGLFRRNEPDEHDELFLFLYDAWVAVYGKTFADEQVAIEKSRGGVYPAAWDAALVLSPAERAAAWKRIVDERLVRRI